LYFLDSLETLQVTNDGNATRRYTQPTWSADGSKVSFNMNTATESRVLVYVLAEEKIYDVFTSRSGEIIYSYWSPDNQNLGFIASQRGGGFVLRFGDYSKGKLVELDEGVPYFWDYSPDGSSIISHNRNFDSGDDLITVLLSHSGDIQTIELQPGHFSAPDWSVDATRISAAIRKRPGVYNVVVMNEAGEIEQEYPIDDALVAFSFSPDGTKIAILNTLNNNSNYVAGDLNVYDLNSGDKIAAIEGDTIVAFFWSPDSSKIVTFTPNLLPGEQQQGNSSGKIAAPVLLQHQDITMDVTVLILSTQQRQLIAKNFGISEAMFQVIFFFDQYQRSDTIWSPDSNWLVLSGRPLLDESGIWLIQTSTLETKLIGTGNLAFWSWQ
jgi:dipeptidyl aminopeptidase/acylaminoacyl peptidase